MRGLRPLIDAPGRPSEAFAAQREFVVARQSLPYTEVAVTHRGLTWVVALAVAAAPCLRGSGNSWNKLRYAGGTVEAKVNDFDWNTVLTVTPDAIVVLFA